MLLWFLLTCSLVVVLGLDGVLTWSDGMVLLLAFVVAVVFCLSCAVARNRRKCARSWQPSRPPAACSWMNLLRFGIAIVVLYYGAKFVVDTAHRCSAAQWACRRC